MSGHHNEEAATFNRRAKVAPNTVSGSKGSEAHFCKYPQDFDKNASAIDHTPYMKYQGSINGRNMKTVKKNLSNLKQD